MRGRAFNRQITVEKRRTTQDSQYGTEVNTWVPLVAYPGSPTVAVRFWAEVQDVLPSRSESVAQGLQVARNQTRLRMRWRDDIDSTMRVIVHGDSDTYYSIVGGPAEIMGRKVAIEMVLERFSS